jgi:hypothetical protein
MGLLLTHTTVILPLASKVTVPHSAPLNVDVTSGACPSAHPVK